MKVFDEITKNRHDSLELVSENMNVDSLQKFIKMCYKLIYKYLFTNSWNSHLCHHKRQTLSSFHFFKICLFRSALYLSPSSTFLSLQLPNSFSYLIFPIRLICRFHLSLQDTVASAFYFYFSPYWLINWKYADTWNTHSQTFCIQVFQFWIYRTFSGRYKA